MLHHMYYMYLLFFLFFSHCGKVPFKQNGPNYFFSAESDTVDAYCFLIKQTLLS